MDQPRRAGLTFRAGDGVDLDPRRRQELIEVEATEQIGAPHYERTDQRATPIGMGPGRVC